MKKRAIKTTDVTKSGKKARNGSQSEARSPSGVLNARATNADDEKYIANDRTVTETRTKDVVHCRYSFRMCNSSR